MTLWKPVEKHFGKGWQTKFAKYAGVSERMVRYWVAEEYPVPGPILRVIESLKKAE